MVHCLGICIDEYFIEIFESDEPHTSVYLSNILLGKIPAIQDEYKVDIVALVTTMYLQRTVWRYMPLDGAANMVSMRTTVQQSLDTKDLFHFSCQAHAVHLLIQDYAKEKTRDSIIGSVVHGLRFSPLTLFPLRAEKC